MTQAATFLSLDAGKGPEQLCAERSKRLVDALERRQPDRIPLFIFLGYLLAEMSKMQRLEMYRNPAKASAGLVAAARRFQPPPFVFYEGQWNNRLKYIAELPKGKSVAWFHNTDIFRAKEILGETACIIGGMPVSLLAGGTPAEVRARTRKVCEVCGKGGGFIMSSGTAELEGCNPDLVQVWADATREFGVY
jgi:uroporphyrinogen-III decarboxylase